jgi:predicted acetyltransferase
MIVVEGERQKGYGTMTLRALRKRCIGQNITPIAGCWYFNHQSKKTIEASGFYSQTRLLRIVF